MTIFIISIILVILIFYFQRKSGYFDSTIELDKIVSKDNQFELLENVLISFTNFGSYSKQQYNCYLFKDFIILTESTDFEFFPNKEKYKETILISKNNINQYPIRLFQKIISPYSIEPKEDGIIVIRGVMTSKNIFLGKNHFFGKSDITLKIKTNLTIEKLKNSIISYCN